MKRKRITSSNLSSTAKLGMVAGVFVFIIFLLGISGAIGDFVQNVTIRTNTGLESGLAAYWTFDGGTATSTVADASGNNRTLTSRDFVRVLSDNTQGTTTYTVPSNATLLYAKLWGAGGGGTVSGGNGGFARGQFGVAPGESLTYEVGDAGSGGGGASTIKRGSTYLIIAGGGGAGGGILGPCGPGLAFSAFSGSGGQGGGLVGGPGGEGGCTDDFTSTSGGGGGGDQSSGGIGGGDLGPGTDGSSGVANAGGNSGFSPGTCGTNTTGCGGGGQGGGGGYYGGGGSEESEDGFSGTGGGGGGSSFHNNNFVVASSTLSGDLWPNEDDRDRGGAGKGDTTAFATDGAVVLYAHQQATTTRVAGRLGQGVNFSINTATTSAGTSTLLSLGSTSNVVQNIGVATVAFWVKTDDFSTSIYQTPLNISRGTTDQTPRLQVQIVGTSTTQGVIRVSARAGDTEAIQHATTTSKGLDEGKWHHIVAVSNYAGDSITVYVDGVATSTTGTISFTASATSNTAPKAVELGRSATSTLSNFNDPFVGVLDDVRIYNRELSSPDVLRLYQVGATTVQNVSISTNPNLGTNLSLYLPFDKVTVGTSSILDQSSNSYSSVFFNPVETSYTTAATSTYVVPTGVTQITAKVSGAGGSGAFCTPVDIAFGDCTGGDGGSGGYVQADLSVTPGESLTVETGAVGGGGGASTVKRSSTYLLIAGGGGGGGSSHGGAGGPHSGGSGGSGGGTSGDSGSAGTTGNAGGAGTSSAGGSGGSGGTGADGSAGVANAGGNGSSGGTGTCGGGGVGCPGSGSPGGGGGGGYYGGGGGEGSGGSGTGAGGGGGGSSFVSGTRTISLTGNGSSGGLGDQYISCGDPACVQAQSATAGTAGVVNIVAPRIGTTTAVAGRLGQGVKFDGTSDFVRIATSSGMTLVRNSSAASAAFWIKVDDFSTFSTNIHQTPIHISRGATDVSTRFQVQVVGTSTTQGVVRVSARAGDGESIQYATTTSKGLNEGQWHHVVAVADYANDTITVYIDGNATSTTGTIAFTASATSNTAPLLVELGRSEAGVDSNQFGGTLDDLRVYNGALPANEVKRLYQIGATTQVNVPIAASKDLSSGLVGHWTFDGPRLLQNVTDSSGAGNTAYLGDVRGAPSATTTVLGRIGQSIDLDGTNTYVRSGDIAVVDTATQLTSCAWVYHDTLTSDDTIISKLFTGGSQGWHLFRDDSGATSGRTDTYSIEVQDSADTDSARLEGATNASTASAWTHVCFTFTASSATGLRLYVNGVEDANSPVSVSTIALIDGLTANVDIGARQSGTATFDGRIDDVRLYTRALSSAEIKRLYQTGSPSGFAPSQIAFDKHFFIPILSHVAVLPESGRRQKVRGSTRKMI